MSGLFGVNDQALDVSKRHEDERTNKEHSKHDYCNETEDNFCEESVESDSVSRTVLLSKQKKGGEDKRDDIQRWRSKDEKSESRLPLHFKIRQNEVCVVVCIDLVDHLLVDVREYSNNHVKQENGTDHNVDLIDDSSKHDCSAAEEVEREVSKTCVKKSGERGRVIFEFRVLIVEEAAEDEGTAQEESSEDDHEVSNDLHHHQDHSDVHAKGLSDHDERTYFQPYQQSHAHVESQFVSLEIRLV